TFQTTHNNNSHSQPTNTRQTHNPPLLPAFLLQQSNIAKNPEIEAQSLQIEKSQQHTQHPDDPTFLVSITRQQRANHAANPGNMRRNPVVPSLFLPIFRNFPSFHCWPWKGEEKFKILFEFLQRISPSKLPKFCPINSHSHSSEKGREKEILGVGNFLN
ncbi:hypothetical protein AABB24_037273, partial [Solanum stoloniferum]